MSRPRLLLLLVMCTGYFFVLLDVTIVNVALPHIRTGLHAGVIGLQWIVDGYMAALAALMLPSGAAGDVHGHRKLVLAGLAVFGLGSLGAGLAPTVAVLVAARVVQGVGAALLLPATLAVITHAFPERSEQARAIGIWAGVGSLALPAGPLLGGALVDWVGWRSVFLINLPIVVVAAAASLRLVPESQMERTREPLLPLLRKRWFLVGNGAAAAMNLGTLGTLFLLTLYLQTVQGRSALEAGVETLPLFLPLALVAPLAGRVVARTGPRVPLAAGLLVAAAGLGLLERARADSPYLVLLPALALWGVGLAALTPAAVAAAVGAAGETRAGVASAVNNTARQAGGAVGIIAFGALAGSPSTRDAFVRGFHEAALAAGALYVAVALVALAVTRRA